MGESTQNVIVREYAELEQGDAAFNEGRYQEAEREYREAVAVIRAQLTESAALARAKLAAAVCAQAKALAKLAEYVEARQLIDEAIELCSHAPAVDDELMFVKSEALRISAKLYMTLAQFAAATPQIEEAYKIRTALLGKDHLETAKVLFLKGTLLRLTESSDEAEKCLGESLKLTESAVGKGHPETFEIILALARVFQDAGDVPRCDWNRELAQRICTEHFRDDDPRRADMLTTIAFSNLRKALCKEANSQVDEALSIYRKAFKPEHPRIGHAMLVQAAANAPTNLAPSIEPFYAALQKIEKSLGPDHPEVASALLAIALRLPTAKQGQEACKLLERAVSIAKKVYGADDVHVVTYTTALGKAYSQTGQGELGEKLIKLGYEMRVKAFGRDHPRVAESLEGMANCLIRKNPEEAIKLLQEVLEIRERIYGTDSSQILNSVSIIAKAYSVIGNLSEAARWGDRAVKIAESVFRDDGPSLAAYYRAQSVREKAQGHWAAAANLQKKRIELMQQANDGQWTDYEKAVCELAESLSLLEQYSEAEESLRALLSSAEIDGTRKGAILYSLARLKLRQTDDQEAEIYLMEARQVTAADSPQLLAILQLLTAILVKQKRHEEALPLFTESVALQEKAQKNSMALAESLYGLSWLHKELGHKQEAEEIKNRAAAMMRPHLFSKTPDSMKALASKMITLNKYAEAEKLLGQLLAQAEQQASQRPLQIAELVEKLAMCAEGQNQLPKAETLFKRALTIRDGVTDKYNPMSGFSFDRLAEIMRKTGRDEEADALLASRKAPG